MPDDEVSALQEQLSEAREEIERLQATAADGEARALHFDGLNAELRRQLAAAQADLSAAQAEAASHQEKIGALDEELSTARTDLAAAQVDNDGLHARLQAAVGKYRQVLLAAAPEVAEEIVGGESIEDVDAAMERARQMVHQVRERLESQAQAGRVPVGSPPRAAPDLSALSPIEKIRLGLSHK